MGSRFFGRKVLREETPCSARTDYWGFRSLKNQKTLDKVMGQSVLLVYETNYVYYTTPKHT